MVYSNAENFNLQQEYFSFKTYLEKHSLFYYNFIIRLAYLQKQVEWDVFANE